MNKERERERERERENSREIWIEKKQRKTL